MSNTALSREKIMLTPVASILDTNAIILEGDRYLDEGLRMMQERNSRCILVSHLGEVMGLISETDILFKVAQENRSPHKVKLREIMTTICGSAHPNNIRTSAAL
jgi:predicted transcriptional regulator